MQPSGQVELASRTDQPVKWKIRKVSAIRDFPKSFQPAQMNTIANSSAYGSIGHVGAVIVKCDHSPDRDIGGGLVENNVGSREKVVEVGKAVLKPDKLAEEEVVARSYFNHIPRRRVSAVRCFPPGCGRDAELLSAEELKIALAESKNHCLSCSSSTELEESFVNEDSELEDDDNVVVVEEEEEEMVDDDVVVEEGEEEEEKEEMVDDDAVVVEEEEEMVDDDAVVVEEEEEMVDDDVVVEEGEEEEEKEEMVDDDDVVVEEEEEEEMVDDDDVVVVEEEEEMVDDDVVLEEEEEEMVDDDVVLEEEEEEEMVDDDGVVEEKEGEDMVAETVKQDGTDLTGLGCNSFLNITRRRVSAVRCFPPGCGRNAVRLSEEELKKAVAESKNHCLSCSCTEEEEPFFDVDSELVLVVVEEEVVEVEEEVEEEEMVVKQEDCDEVVVVEEEKEMVNKKEEEMVEDKFGINDDKGETMEAKVEGQREIVLGSRASRFSSTENAKAKPKAKRKSFTKEKEKEEEEEPRMVVKGLMASTQCIWRNNPRKKVRY